MTVRPSSEEILNPRCHHQFIQYPMIILFSRNSSCPIELSVVGPSVERLTPAHATSGIHAEAAGASSNRNKGKLEVCQSVDSTSSSATSIRSRSSFKKKGKQASTRERSPAMPGSNRGSRDPTPVPGDAKRDHVQESHKVATNFIPYKMGEDGRTCYYSGLGESIIALLAALLFYSFLALLFHFLLFC